MNQPEIFKKLDNQNTDNILPITGNPKTQVQVFHSTSFIDAADTIWRHEGACPKKQIIVLKTICFYEMDKLQMDG